MVRRRAGSRSAACSLPSLKGEDPNKLTQGERETGLAQLAHTAPKAALLTELRAKVERVSNLKAKAKARAGNLEPKVRTKAARARKVRARGAEGLSRAQATVRKGLHHRPPLPIGLRTQQRRCQSSTRKGRGEISREIPPPHRTTSPLSWHQGKAPGLRETLRMSCCR